MNEHDHIVVDVEIANAVEDVGGWGKTGSMGVGIACVWEYTTQRMRVFGAEDLDALKKRILEADRVTSYNGMNFDYPVIWGVDRADWRDSNEQQLVRYADSDRMSSVSDVRAILLDAHDDLLRRAWESLGLDPDKFVPKTHGGLPLAQVSIATLGAQAAGGKTANGADAPRWYQEGQHARVADYCAADVALTRDLCDFVERHGYLLNKIDQKITLEHWHADE